MKGLKDIFIFLLLGIILVIVDNATQEEQNKIFVDNQLFASGSKNLNTDGSMPLIVGSNSLTRDDEFFSGKLDDLRVYDRALSTAEVQTLYNLGQ